MGSLIRLPFRAFAVGSLVVVMIAAAVLIVFGAVGTTPAGATATAPTLGGAKTFAVLAHTTVTNSGPTTISGDLGVYSGAAVTGFVTSTTPGAGVITNPYHKYPGTVIAGAAQAGLLIAYGAAYAATPTTTQGTQTLGAGETLSAGVYNASTSMAVTGTLTLTGTASSVFIFQAGTTLITGADTHVNLVGGVNACNVFWQVGSSATFTTGTHFAGTVMATASISLLKTVVITGRVLAMTGAVTLETDLVTLPTCAAPPTVTASVSSATSVTLGTSVHDTVTVTGNVTDGTPTGTVQFYRCGTLSTATGILCTVATGTTVGGAVTLSGGIATSPTFTPVAIGIYCFAAVFIPAVTSPYLGSVDVGTTANGECFTVTTIPGVPPVITPPPTITTSAVSARLVTLGASVHDIVTVTGNATDGLPTGTVQFYRCGALSTGTGILCALGTGTLVGGAALVTGIADSPNFTPGAIGTYCFAAVYAPAVGSPYLASSEAGTTANGECFTVTTVPGVPPVITPPPTVTTSAASATLVTLGASVHDVVTVTGNATDGIPAGSVQFYRCGPPSILCASSAGAKISIAATLNARGIADSPNFTPSAAGTYCFASVYIPAAGSPYLASSEAGSTTDGECFTVTAAPVVPLPVITPAHTPPTHVVPAAAVVPSAHTGEPWAGWVWWFLVAVFGIAGFGLFADRARRRRLSRGDGS